VLWYVCGFGSVIINFLEHSALGHGYTIWGILEPGALQLESGTRIFELGTLQLEPGALQ
jgi:hypothetical protein